MGLDRNQPTQIATYHINGQRTHAQPEESYDPSNREIWVSTAKTPFTPSCGRRESSQQKGRN
jgi:hypothetical protein